MVNYDWWKHERRRKSMHCSISHNYKKPDTSEKIFKEIIKWEKSKSLLVFKSGPPRQNPITLPIVPPPLPAQVANYMLACSSALVAEIPDPGTNRCRCTRAWCAATSGSDPGSWPTSSSPAETRSCLEWTSGCRRSWPRCCPRTSTSGSRRRRAARTSPGTAGLTCQP